MSQFIIIAYDATDAGGLERRMAHRAEHLAAIEKGRAAGNMICGLALTDDNDKMIGSLMVTNFPTREAFDAWLATEPFVVHKVWGEITVHTAKLAPPYADLIKKAV